MKTNINSIGSLITVRKEDIRCTHHGRTLAAIGSTEELTLAEVYHAIGMDATIALSNFFKIDSKAMAASKRLAVQLMRYAGENLLWHKGITLLKTVNAGGAPTQADVEVYVREKNETASGSDRCGKKLRWHRDVLKGMLAVCSENPLLGLHDIMWAARQRCYSINDYLLKEYKDIVAYQKMEFETFLEQGVDYTPIQDCDQSMSILDVLIPLHDINAFVAGGECLSVPDKRICKILKVDSLVVLVENDEGFQSWKSPRHLRPLSK